jgi:hypothetical protein
MRDNRGPWYLLTGLVIGIVIGLLYAWVVRPVQYTNTLPRSLRAEDKDQYRALIASAYLANGDTYRASERLKLLRDADLYRTLAEQAQRTLAEGGSSLEARALGILAVTLGQAPPTLAIPSGSPVGDTSSTPASTSLSGTPPASGGSETAPASGETPVTPQTATATITGTLTSDAPTGTPGTSQPARPSSTPAPSDTPLPTRTPTATQGAPFVLESQEQLCDPSLTTPLIQVETFDAASQPVPGVEVVVSWDGGENHFYTGVKSEVSPGYADFDMTPGVNYTLRLAEGGQPITGIAASECETAGGEQYWGGWSLVFVQP